MGKMQREKGKRGERELAGILRDYGYKCDRTAGRTYRGQAGGRPETPESITAGFQGCKGGRDSGGNASAQL